MAGQPDDLEWLSGWLVHLRNATSEGRRYERVRRVSDPPTDYQAWSLTIAPNNVEAGEDLRLIEEDQAHRLGLPDYDFVVVNDQVVACMEFGASGFTGAALLRDPDAVTRHRDWRALAWQHAVTVSTYMSRSP